VNEEPWASGHFEFKMSVFKKGYMTLGVLILLMLSFLLGKVGKAYMRLLASCDLRWWKTDVQGTMILLFVRFIKRKKMQSVRVF